MGVEDEQSPQVPDQKKRRIKSTKGAGRPGVGRVQRLGALDDFG